ALSLDPLLPDAYAAVAESHRYEGRFAEGLEVCNKALRLEPNSYMSNRVAGMCLMGLRRFDEAAARFESAVAALESDIIAATFAVQCYQATNDTGRAIEAARRALSRVEKVIATQPDHSRAIGFGVGLLATLGEKERAREWVLRGQLLDPTNVVMLYNFSCAMVQLGDLETAFELLRDFTAHMQPGLLRWFESDSDFDPIRQDPRFVTMLADAKLRLGVTG
ncbi:MAG TPA: hypothetical protein VF277_08835, partial [Steroidobacteraceae bacterium]